MINYEGNFQQIEFAEKLNVSKQYISKIVRADDRYQKARRKQKEETKKRKKQYTRNKMKQIREKESALKAYLKQQHLQATSELSKGAIIPKYIK